MKIKVLGIFLSITLTGVHAAEEQPQTAPAFPMTDIFVADLKSENGAWRVGSPVNVTNRAVYDNQPFFTADGRKFYYTAESGGQTDLFLFDLENNTRKRVLSTPQSEFSPTVMPDGSGLSTVVIEDDGTQRLWRVDFDGSNYRLLVEEVTGVGYHAWIGNNKIAMFIVGDPVTLHVLDREIGTVSIMDENIGRALTVYPGSSMVLVYTGPGADDATWVKSLDLESGVIQTLISVPGEAQDMAWLPDGSLLMSDRGRVMRWGGGADDRWELLADFSDSLGPTLTRMAISPNGDKIALVAEHPAD